MPLLNYLIYWHGKKCKCKYRDKYKLLDKAEKIINDKLDIIIFIKNMIILDIFHFNINNNIRNIYKLLSMPIISSDNDENENIQRFQWRYFWFS